MTIKIPTCFSYPDDMGKLTSKSPEWHFRAFILWHLLPPKISMEGIGWLLGQSDGAVEKTAKRLGWESRRSMRVKDRQEVKKKIKEISNPAPVLIKNGIDIDGNIPRVSLIRIIKFVEYQVMEGARSSNPHTMNGWLSTLAGLDAAQRARKTRILDKITKNSVKVYIPQQDPIPTMDVEDAQIIPDPVVF
jgi:hypothetical protein